MQVRHCLPGLNLFLNRPVERSCPESVQYEVCNRASKDPELTELIIRQIGYPLEMSTRNDQRVSRDNRRNIIYGNKVCGLRERRRPDILTTERTGLICH